MEKCQDKELIKKSVQYFAVKENLKELFVTSDGQFFYTENATSHHCRTNGLRVYSISRDEVMPQTEKAPEEEIKKEEIKVEEVPKEETKVKTDTSSKKKKTKKSVKDG